MVKAEIRIDKLFVFAKIGTLIFYSSKLHTSAAALPAAAEQHNLVIMVAS